MLKLSASYSKKVPVEGQEFSSQGYQCSVERELSENLAPDELKAQIAHTFALVRHSVEAELNGGQAKPQPESNGNGNGSHNGSNSPRASNKQVKFILDLAKARGLSLADVNTRVQSQYEAEDVYSLSRREASRLVDQLKEAA